MSEKAPLSPPRNDCLQVYHRTGVFVGIVLLPDWVSRTQGASEYCVSFKKVMMCLYVVTNFYISFNKSNLKDIIDNLVVLGGSNLSGGQASYASPKESNTQPQ